MNPPPAPKPDESVTLNRAVKWLIGLVAVFMAMYAAYYYTNTRDNYRSVVAEVDSLAHTQMPVWPDAPLQRGENQFFAMAGLGAMAGLPQPPDSTWQVPYRRTASALGSGSEGVAWRPRSRAATMEANCVHYAGTPDKAIIDSLLGRINQRFRNPPPMDYRRFEGAPLLFHFSFRRIGYLPEVRLCREPLRFGGLDVRCLNFMPLREKVGDTSRRVLSVADGTENFQALRLQLDSLGAEAYFVQMEPDSTLWATYRKARRLLKQFGPLQTPHEPMRIQWPLIDFNLVRTRGLADVMEPSQGVPPIALYYQNKLMISSASPVLGQSEAYAAPSADSPLYRFDRPFLLVLRKIGADWPHLLAWIGHPEVLVPHQR
jgi:hypothetical protein